MTPQHTPGPWRAVKDDSGGSILGNGGKREPEDFVKAYAAANRAIAKAEGPK